MLGDCAKGWCGSKELRPRCPTKSSLCFLRCFSLTAHEALKRRKISDTAFSSVPRSIFCAAWPHSDGSQESLLKHEGVQDLSDLPRFEFSALGWQVRALGCCCCSPRWEEHRRLCRALEFRMRFLLSLEKPKFPDFYFFFRKNLFSQLRGMRQKIAFPEKWAKISLFCMPKVNSSTVIICAEMNIFSSFVSICNYCQRIWLRWLHQAI